MTALSTTQKIEIIQRAQGLLRERGWVKGEFCDQYGESTAICANGALARAAGRGGRNWHELAPRDLLEEIVADLPFPDYPAMDPEGRICGFNNREADTVEDVIAQFQITIDRLARQNHPASRERELVDA
jgi:hypothetical protein